EEESEYESDNDTDTVIDYPFDIREMMKAKPVRINISIGNELVEAVVDSGAAVSVISRKLADRLGLVP
ncbi:hypothetical protein K501DRAFT_145211, partial [Backusella circina FSU 941]